MNRQEDKMMVLFCPYINGNCKGSKCIAWTTARVDKDHEGKEIKVGRCDYGRN